LTRAVFENYVAVPEGVTGPDETGRLWDVVWITRFGINRAARLVKLIATCGPFTFYGTINGTGNFGKQGAMCAFLCFAQTRIRLKTVLATP